MNIYLKDYDALIEQGDSTLALAEALHACKDGDTLCLGGGERHFYPKYALQKEYYVSNNAYCNQSIAFLLIGRKNLTVDGEGAKLIFHEQITPFVIEKCDGVTVKNLEIDYAVPVYFQAEITAAGDTFTEIEFDPTQFRCKLVNGNLCFYSPEEGWSYECSRTLVTEFEPHPARPSGKPGPYFCCLKPAKRNFLAWLFRDMKATQLSETKIRFDFAKDAYPAHQVGNYWLCTFCGRSHPGFLLHETNRTVLQDVRLTHTMGMGVIAQLSEDIRLERVIAEPKPGRLLSVNADATHFVNCSGQITLKDCKFVSMMDDAGNFHGDYTVVQRKINAHTLLSAFGAGDHVGVPLYRAGDTIRLVRQDTMMPVGTYTVAESTFFAKKYVRLSVNETLPADLTGLVVENIDRMPSVHLDGCECGNNRPRGFLITTNKPVLVEHCSFYNMECALEFAGDANSWYESGPVSDITVRDNTFCNSAYCGGAVIKIEPKVPTVTDGYYHRNIRIINNAFTLHEKRFLNADSTENLQFRDNTYHQDASLPSWPQNAENGLQVVHCTGIIEEPKEI